DNSDKGLESPTKEINDQKFTPYVTSKNRLTTHFYVDLVEYYRKCQGDSPPSPVVVHNRGNDQEITETGECEQGESGKAGGTLCFNPVHCREIPEISKSGSKGDHAKETMENIHKPSETVEKERKTDRLDEPKPHKAKEKSGV